jgi:hypothetical protein
MVKDDIIYSEVESAVHILRQAKKQKHMIYLKGCIAYIKNMKPASLEV